MNKTALRLALALLLPAMPGTALAAAPQPGLSRGESPPAVTGPIAPTDGALPALAKARRAIAAALQKLEVARGVGDTGILADAYHDTRAARELVLAAISQARGEGLLQDATSDMLQRAADQAAEVARGLNQLAPPVNPASVAAAAAHLREVAAKVDQAAARIAEAR